MTPVRKPPAEHQQEIVETALHVLSGPGAGPSPAQTIAGRIVISATGSFQQFPPQSHLWTAALKDVRNRTGCIWNRMLPATTTGPAHDPRAEAARAVRSRFHL